MAKKLKNWAVKVYLERSTVVYVRAEDAEAAKRKVLDLEWDDEDPGELVNWEIKGEPEEND